MKLNIFPFIIFFLFVFTNCSSNDADNNIITLENIKDITATPGEKKVTLSWVLPEIEEIDYTLISYQEDGIEKEIKVPYSGLANQQISIEVKDLVLYKFYLEIVFNNGSKHDKKSIKGKSIYEPKSIDYDQILKSIKILPISGVKIIWSNPKDLNVMIECCYNNEKVEIPANANLREYNIDEISYGNSIEFSFRIIDKNGISDVEPLVLEVTPLPSIRLNKDSKLWLIETNSEVASIGEGAVANLFDEDPWTYWRTEKAASEEDYYFEVLVDMMSVKEIIGFSLERKFNDNSYSSWDISLSVSNDKKNWVEYNYSNKQTGIFKKEFDRTINYEQYYQVPENTTGRYIKLGCHRAHKNHLIAIYGSWNIYGL